MSIPLLFGWWRRPATPKPIELDFLHSRSRFRDILEVERMRSDRTELPFALVVFRLPEPSPPSEADRAAGRVEGLDDVRVRFARYLERRRRATDHLGEMHAEHIGVVLWNTADEGAWTFARDVVRTWPGGDIPEFDVFSYPTYVPPEQREKNDDDDRTPVPPHESDEREGASDATVTNTESPTKPLEMLFVQPLPFWKRVIDVCGAGVGLVLLTPLFLLVAGLIKLTSKGPVFFAQTRTGHGGRPFTILKFRTMCTDAEAQKDALRVISEQDGPAFKLASDPRITRVGRFLRKTCIDELPQLWNVLKGDMTLVGPRPLDVKEADLTTGWERRRLDITPGLTCIWQVDGKSRVTFAEWMRMDIRYTRVRSFGQDVKLVLRTIAAMLRLKASQ